MPDAILSIFEVSNLFIQTRAWKGFTNASLGQRFEYIGDSQIHYQSNQFPLTICL